MRFKILLFSFLILTIFVFPVYLSGSTRITEDNQFELSIEAQLVNGSLITQTHYIGPSSFLYEINAEFIPAQEFSLADNKFDSDDASGMSGYFYCSVTGYYTTGSNYFHQEKHYGYVDLIAGHTLGSVSLRCQGDSRYDEIKTSLGTYRYYYDIYNDVYTKYRVSVYYLGWYVGDVTLEAHITGP